MIVSMHQPHFFPWLPYMAKILHSETFVLLDDFQFSSRKWINANKIRNRTGELRLSVPVRRGLAPISQTLIVQNGWDRKMFQTLKLAYSRAPRWRQHESFLQATISPCPFQTLADLNIAVIHYCLNDLGYKGTVLRSSKIAYAGKKTAAIISLLQKTGAGAFLNSLNGIEKYMRHDPEFQKLPPVLCWQWRPPVYNQMGCRQFMTNLSILDLLMNTDGPTGARMLKESLMPYPYKTPADLEEAFRR